MGCLSVTAAVGVFFLVVVVSVFFGVFVAGSAQGLIIRELEAAIEFRIDERIAELGTCDANSGPSGSFGWGFVVGASIVGLVGIVAVLIANSGDTEAVYRRMRISQVLRATAGEMNAHGRLPCVCCLSALGRDLIEYECGCAVHRTCMKSINEASCPFCTAPAAKGRRDKPSHHHTACAAAVFNESLPYNGRLAGDAQKTQAFMKEMGLDGE